MALKLSNTALVALCLTASAVLFFFGTGLSPIWAVLWFAPVPVLWLAPRTSVGMAFFAAAAAFAIGTLNEWSYLSSIVPLGIAVMNSVVPACLFGSAVSLFRCRARKGKLWQATWIVPAFWVTYEYISSLLSVHGTIGNFGYTQLNFLPILQIASATGIWGITFSVFLFSAALAAVLSQGPFQKKLQAAIPAALFLVCVFGYGFWRLASTPKDSSWMKVGLIASDDSENLVVPTVEAAQTTFDRLSQKMQQMNGQGIQAFLLPEHSGPITDQSEANADAIFEQAATATHAYVAIGVDRIGAKKAWNQERLYAPNGSLLATYNKHHLLPHFEDRFEPSRTRTSLDIPYAAMSAKPVSEALPTSGKIGLQICKDMDFPPLSRQYAQDGVALMLVPGWDFVIDAWEHGHIAIMRGVEGGFSVVRSAKKSTVYAADDRGRVIGEATTGWAPFTTLVASVPVRHDATLYTKLGNWFAWLSMLLLASLSAEIFLGRS